MLVTRCVYIPHSRKSNAPACPSNAATRLHALQGWEPFPSTSRSRKCVIYLRRQSRTPNYGQESRGAGQPRSLQAQPCRAQGDAGSYGAVLFGHITSLGNNAVKKRNFQGRGVGRDSAVPLKRPVSQIYIPADVLLFPFSSGAWELQGKKQQEEGDGNEWEMEGDRRGTPQGSAAGLEEGIPVGWGAAGC